jgi:superfamily II DNA or RNA helicase
MVPRKNISMLISKKNEVYIKLNDLEQSVAAELNDFFTFEVPGFKYMPAYRSKQWDGKIRLYNIFTGEIYLGLLPYIKEFLNARSIEFELEKGVRRNRAMPRDLVQGFIQGLKPTLNGRRIEVRDYQLDAIIHALASDRALLISPTASGKSLIIYCLIRYYHMKGLKTLILVPTTSLVEQMYKDFTDYGWSSETYCQKIYQGHDKKVTKDVVISTWQSIHRLQRPYFRQFGCVIGDEAHLFKAKSLTGILTKMDTCEYRFGLTGTLDGTQTHRLVLEGLFGKAKYVVTTKELIDNKTLADLEINCIVLNYPEEDRQIVKEFDYGGELEYIVTKPQRNDFLCNLVGHFTGNTLCLFQFVEKHGKILYELIRDKYTDRKVFFVYGGVDTNTREEIREIVENEKDAIIIASYGTFSTGINIRNIHNIVFASPSKSKIRVLQSLGRGLRQVDAKKLKLFDISDDLSTNNLTGSDRINFTLRHFKERLKIYNDQRFNYKIDRVNL